MHCVGPGAIGPAAHSRHPNVLAASDRNEQPLLHLQASKPLVPASPGTTPFANAHPGGCSCTVAWTGPRHGVVGWVEREERGYLPSQEAWTHSYAQTG